MAGVPAFVSPHKKPNVLSYFRISAENAVFGEDLLAAYEDLNLCDDDDGNGDHREEAEGGVDGAAEEARREVLAKEAAEILEQV